VTSAPSDCGTVVEELNRFGERFTKSFSKLLEPPDGVPARLAEAVRYSALGPGKRIRPFLVTRCCELVGGTYEMSLGAAAAVECVHAFSLVHDDLPAMDDDDLRRGRPTNHKVFGEATAILAGDALVALAFELIVTHTPDPARAARLVAELARGTGWAGMIAGQTADMEGEHSTPDRGRVEFIHERKTASLMAAACRMGAIAGGGGPDAVDRLGEFGRHVGLAFQIADDLLDVTANVEDLGKPVRKDAGAGKQTYPRCVGPEQSRQAGEASIQAALAALAPFGDQARNLAELARYCLSRKH
jgi:geranylgeranyl diphosphate synthase type II